MFELVVTSASFIFLLAAIQHYSVHAPFPPESLLVLFVIILLLISRAILVYAAGPLLTITGVRLELGWNQ